MTNERIESSIVELARGFEVAVAAHVRWLEDLHTTLVCGGDPPDEVEERESLRLMEAWQRSNASMRLLGGHREYENLMQQTTLVHEHASALVRIVQRHEPVDLESYRAFLRVRAQLSAYWGVLRQLLLGSAHLTDPLTSMELRAPFAMMLDKTHETAVRGGPPYTLAMLGVDDFAGILAAEGRESADRMLIYVADLLRRELRRSDTVCRYSGDKFAMLLMGTSLEPAFDVVTRICKQFERDALSLGGDVPAGTTVSAGVATWSQRVQADDCLRRADHSLRAAWRSGRSQTLRWTAEHEDSATQTNFEAV